MTDAICDQVNPLVTGALIVGAAISASAKTTHTKQFPAVVVLA
jgi:hypothetical protein